MNTRDHNDSSFCYGIWGIGPAAYNLFNYITDEYPSAKFVSAIDMYKVGKFQGVKIVTPNEYNREFGEVIFVLPVQASNMAGEVLELKGFTQGEYVCAGDVFINK